MKPSLNLRDTAIVIALGAGATLFWYLRLILPATEMHAGSGDLYTQIYPMALRAADWIRKGHIPLWNPLQFCGQPFLASVLYGIFYPFNFPILLFSTAVALELIAILHLFLAGAFTYAYARSIAITRYGAAAAGIVFMLSGFVASQALWFTPAVGAIVWLPLGFLAVERIFERRSVGGAVLLACAVAMPVLAGWLQTWTYSMHAIAAYAGVRLFIAVVRSPERRTVLRPAVLLAGGFALGLCLAGVQLLPSMELQRLGPRRPGGLSLSQTLSLGPVTPRHLLADAVNARPGFPRQMYVGMLPLIIMPLSWFARSGRQRIIFLWGLGLWSIVVAMSVYTPAFTLFRMLPGGAWFRVPWRMVFVYAFAAAVLTGVGLDTLVRMATERERRAWWPIGLVTSIAVLCLAIISMPGQSVAYVIATVALVWAVWLTRTPRVRAAMLMALLGLLTVDLFVATRSPALHPFHDLSVYDQEHEAFDFVQAHQGLYRTYIHWSWPGNPALMPKQGTLRGIFSITDYEPLSLERYDKFYRHLDSRRASEVDADPNRNPFIGYLELSPTPPALRLLDLLSVRFIISSPVAIPFYQALVRPGSPWQISFHSRELHERVYENPTVLPRAYVAHSWQVVSDGDAALQAVTAARFDAHHAVVLESSPAVVVPAAPAVAAGVRAQAVTWYQPTRVEIDSDDPAAGFLVLTDTFYPGWNATVDGRVTTVLRANYLFRAVPLPPGHHRVTFVYDPLSFKLGAALTVGALCCITAWAGYAGYRRWRMQAPA